MLYLNVPCIRRICKPLLTFLYCNYIYKENGVSFINLTDFYGTLNKGSVNCYKYSRYQLYFSLSKTIFLLFPECLPGTFLYKDRCWSHCPEQSYMVPEIPRSRNRNNDFQPDENIISVRSTLDDQYVPNSTLFDEPSEKRAIMPPIPQKRCAPCHVSCLLCRGPDPNECLQCHPGNHLTIVSADETYCYPATNGNNLSRATGQLSSGEDTDDDSLLKDLSAFWSVVVPSMVVIVFVVVFSLLGAHLISRWKNSNTHSYEKVAFDVPNEEVEVVGNKGPARTSLDGTSGPADVHRVLIESSSDSDLF